MRIGIGITTHNRPDVFEHTYGMIKKFAPRGAKIVVVDDYSDTPAAHATYRFEPNVGIARAKNKCLELLGDCDHIFLFDDDTYPLTKDWWVPYVRSPEPHLMYCFENWSSGTPVGDDCVYYKDDAIVAHKAARGCMLYIARVVLDTVGGFDIAYGKAMNEHLDWSNRIYNAGLTTFKHADVANSSELIYSSDEHKEVTSSVARADRMANLMRNNVYLTKNADSAEYKPYGTSFVGKGVVITTYLTCGVDVQRNQTWNADYEATKTLRDSVDGKSEMVLLNDCFDEPDYGTIKHVRVRAYDNPYFMRWLAIWRYLRDHPDIAFVWIVDATDTELLGAAPFDCMGENIIYTGDEPSIVGSQWMRMIARAPEVIQFVRNFSNMPLLNCGVIGGSRDDLMAMCRRIYSDWVEGGCKEIADMPIFNKMMYETYHARIRYGRGITTVFKKYEDKGAIWRHK